MRRLCTLLLCLMAAPAGATTFYTAKTGNDSFTCTQAQSTNTPKLTINAGIACLSGGGDTLFVRAGTYVENVTSGVPSGTSWANKVRIAAYFPETVTLQPSGGNYAVIFLNNESYVEWDGINIDGANLTGSNVGDNFRVEAWAGGSPHHIRVKNSVMLGTTQNTGSVNSQPQMVQFIMSVAGRQGFNEMINCTLSRGGGNQDFSHSVYISSDNNLVDGNDISGSTGIGVQVYNGYSLDAHDNIIRNNIIHDSAINSGFRTRGILVSGTNNQVYNNVVYNLGNTLSIGIDEFSGSPLVYNNTVYNAKVGLYIEGQSGSIIRNNILFGNTSGDYNANGFSPTQDHNLIGTDPSFVDAANHNFRLQNSSVAKDTGTNTGSIATLVTTDILGTVRPQNGTYDIGAYEYTTGGGGGGGGPTRVPAMGTIVVTDTFTDASAGLALILHAGETGATWATQTGSSAGLVISNANRLRINAATVDTFSYASGVPVSAQYDVRGDFHTFTTITDNTQILWAHMSTSVRTGYMSIYNRVPGALELWAVVANAYTQLGSCSVTFADGSDNTVEIEVRTGAQQLWYWPTASPSTPTQCVSAVDTTIPAAGLAGLGLYAAATPATNTTDTHVDKIVVQDVAIAAAPATCTACRMRFTK